MTDRNVVTKPRERADPALSLVRREIAGAPSRSASVLLASGRPSDRLLDLRHASVGRIGPDLVGVPPPADVLVVDLEDARARRELLDDRRFGGHCLVDRAEAVLREQLLRRRRLE